MSVNLTLGRYNRRKGIQSLAYDNMLWTGTRLPGVQDDMEQNLKNKEEDQHALKLKGRQGNRGKGILNGEQSLHHVQFCVAQNTKWTSPFYPLDLAAPKHIGYDPL